MSELVSAVMVTGKDQQHEFFARRAVQSFLDQTYPHTELIVVNDGEYKLAIPDSRVREVVVDRGLTLGELRNVGLDVAQGDWLLQFDDDDWHHPQRIGFQMAARQAGNCVMLTWQVRYSFPRNVAYQYKCDVGIAGTILHPRTAHRYPAKARGEDSDFWMHAFGPARTLVDNRYQPWLYLRFFHGFNTWDEQHIMKQWAGARHRDSWQVAADSRDVLTGALQGYRDFIVKD